MDFLAVKLFNPELRFSPIKDIRIHHFFLQNAHQLEINDTAVKFVEHVGIVRSVHGKLAHTANVFNSSSGLCKGSLLLSYCWNNVETHLLRSILRIHFPIFLVVIGYIGYTDITDTDNDTDIWYWYQFDTI